MTTTVARVDIGALAGAIANEAASRFADLVVLTGDHLEEDGRELSQIQRCQLTQQALRHFDGFQERVALQLRRDLKSYGIETWGLSSELEALMGGQDV